MKKSALFPPADAAKAKSGVTAKRKGRSEVWYIKNDPEALKHSFLPGAELKSGQEAFRKHLIENGVKVD